MNWMEFTEAIRGKRIICYGAGTNALAMLANNKFSPFLQQIDFFIDIDVKKHTTTVNYDKYKFNVYSPTRIDEIKEKQDYVLLITLTDYISVGKIMTQKNILWFPWTIISTDLKFDYLSTLKSPNKSVLFLLGTPDYVNLGDHAIAVAERAYLKKHFGDFFELGIHSCPPYVLDELKKHIKQKDIIFMQGGGNIGSLWRVCDGLFRNILTKFPDNTVILFPQSIYYGSSEEEYAYFKKSQLIFNSHKNLLLCVRDRRSYDFVRCNFTSKCMLIPDMVLMLNTNYSLKRTGVGVLLRNDKEKLLPDEYKEVIYNAINYVEEKVIPLTHHPKNLDINEIKADNYITGNILKEYSACRLIITDRLHGMIFAAITNTPCIAFDNSYRKVSDLYETWLTGCRHITFVKEIMDQAELSALINKKTNETFPKINNQIFIDKFSQLTEYILSSLQEE